MDENERAVVVLLVREAHDLLCREVDGSNPDSLSDLVDRADNVLVGILHILAQKA